jgi:hypothetical protein
MITYISEALLTRILLAGFPVIYGIKYPPGKYAGSHVMLIAGTNGHGYFYLHDPFNVRGRGTFQVLPYSGIYNYVTPGYPNEDPSFGSGTMNQAYVPTDFVALTAENELLASQTLVTNNRTFRSNTTRLV